MSDIAVFLLLPLLVVSIGAGYVIGFIQGRKTNAKP